jgi:hypothetical protein
MVGRRETSPYQVRRGIPLTVVLFYPKTCDIGKVPLKENVTHISPPPAQHSVLLCGNSRQAQAGVPARGGMGEGQSGSVGSSR